MKYSLNNLVEIISSTPSNYDHSVGFHDIRPFNKANNNLVLIHRYPLNNLGFKNKKKISIDICLWDISSDTVNKIDESDAWSWEQGSRLQWINERELIYNKRIDGKLISCVYDINNKSKKNLENTVYSINKNNHFLHINFSRLWKLWRSYGYYSDFEQTNYDSQPTDDGVFLCDTKNEKRIVLSIRDAVKLCKLENLEKDFFLCHPSFNPAGNKFVSLLRFFNDTGALISYFICTDIEKNTSQVLAKEKVSHFEWLTDEKLVVWSRNLGTNLSKLRFNKFIEEKIISNIKKILNLTTTGFKSRILSTSYHLIDLKTPNKLTKLNDKLLTEDGHPQLSPNNRYLITDTYADKEKYQKLILYDLKKKKIYILGKFKLDDYLIKNYLKYDLHPRWDNTGNLICIDSSHQGSRQSYILNIKKLIDEIN